MDPLKKGSLCNSPKIAQKLNNDPIHVTISVLQTFAFKNLRKYMSFFFFLIPTIRLRLAAFPISVSYTTLTLNCIWEKKENLKPSSQIPSCTIHPTL